MPDVYVDRRAPVPDHYNRLEDKVDKLTDAIAHLVRVEERQIAHTDLIAELQRRFESQREDLLMVDKKLDLWINRAVGVWAVSAVIWTVFVAMRGSPS